MSTLATFAGMHAELPIQFLVPKPFSTPSLCQRKKKKKIDQVNKVDEAENVIARNLSHMTPSYLSSIRELSTLRLQQ
jgi:hypothetical protein